MLLSSAPPPELAPLLACLSGQPEGLRLAESDPAALVDLALRQGLAALLYQRLREEGWLSQLGAEEQERLRQYHRTTVERRLRRLDAAAEVSQVLARAGLRFLPLKGWAYLATTGSEALPREMIDLDLLVSREELQAAYELLQEAGCVVADMPWTATPWEYHLPRLELRSVPIEVHWRLWPQAPLMPFELPDFERLWSRSLPGQLEGQALRVPSVEDQFLIQTAALAEDGLTTRLGGWTDLYWLSQLLPPQGSTLWERAAEARMHAYLLVVLDLLRELLQCELPLRFQLPEALVPVRRLMRAIAWRRLALTQPRRASTWMLVALRRLGHGKRVYSRDWVEDLPEWLQPRQKGGPVGWAVLHAGGGLAAGAKAAARLGGLALKPSERREMADDIRLSHLLHGLAGKVR